MARVADQPLDLKARTLSPSPGLDVNEVADGLIVYDGATSQVHHLKLSAATVFDLCDGTRDAAAIAAEVKTLLGVDHDPIDEVVSCLEDLVGLGVVG